MSFIPAVICLWLACFGTLIVVMCHRRRLAKLERDLAILARQVRQNMIARSGP